MEHPAAYTRRAIVHEAVRVKRRHRREADHARQQRIETAPPPEIVEPLAALDRLSPRRRAVIVMRIYEGLPDAEIAAALDCTESTVRSLAHRALRQLEKDLA